MTSPTPRPDEVTTGELGRRMNDMRTDVRELAAKVDQLVTRTDLQSASLAWQSALDGTERRLEQKVDGAVKTIDEHQKAQDAAIAELADWQTWAMRVVLGLVAAAVIGGFIASGGAL